ncbi:hypothetical protein PHMEG_00011492 [Phytophthora megakarya]|uniref:Uncharacterized protein n=1 Tax=Phytophthora megakarya TaxID=4795 RepID=A0A225WB49_9STRA|nr:hypothetical protein PHMEG_00011492 [Phytophthora megakarya]
MDVVKSRKLFKKSRNPELRASDRDNPQCMTSMIATNLPPLTLEPEGRPEFKLNFGERYGWWVEYDPEEDRRQCATGH